MEVLKIGKRARLIYNPAAGREEVEENLPDILNIYEEAGYQTSAFRTTKENNSAMNEARRVVQEGIDLLIVAGGDGTIYEAINGIADLEDRPLVAVLPAGTANDYARALRLPQDNLVEAARAITKGSRSPMDIGRIQFSDKIRYFSNIAAAGHITEVTYEVSPQMKSIFGYLAYITKGVEFLPRLGPVDVEVVYNDGVYKGPATLIGIALTNAVAGFDYVAPDTIPGDGKFTLIIVKTSRWTNMMRLVAQLINQGKHIDNDDIIYVKTDKIYLETTNTNELMINLDGEYGGDTPVVLENLQQHIDFVSNEKMIDQTVELKDDKKEELEEKFISEVRELEEKETLENKDKS